MSDEPEEAELAEVFRALANPATRHFVELLARESRTSEDIREHFDLLPEQVTAMQLALQKLRLVKKDSSDRYQGRVHLDPTGLDQVQQWLDRIAEIRGQSPRPRFED